MQNVPGSSRACRRWADRPRGELIDFVPANPCRAGSPAFDPKQIDRRVSQRGSGRVSRRGVASRAAKLPQRVRWNGRAGSICASSISLHSLAAKWKCDVKWVVSRLASLSVRNDYLVALRMITLSGALFLFAISEVVMASNDLTDFRAKLQQLRSTTDIVLMIVPYPTMFRVRVDEGRLPNVSCVYKIASGRGPTFDQVLDIIGTAVIEYDDGPKPGADLRSGIVFRKHGGVMQDKILYVAQ